MFLSQATFFPQIPLARTHSKPSPARYKLKPAPDRGRRTASYPVARVCDLGCYRPIHKLSGQGPGTARIIKIAPGKARFLVKLIISPAVCCESWTLQKSCIIGETPARKINSKM